MGEVFGLLSDAEIYEAILEQNTTLFCSIVDQLATSLAEDETDFVAADAAEGFSPTHDLCRQIANAAIYQAETLSGRAIASYEFLLTDWDLNGPAIHDQRCWHMQLGDGLLRLKLDAAKEYSELREEVERAIGLRGEEYFRIECFRKVSRPFLEFQRRYKPYYERLGEQRVASGKYSSAIRYESHMAPLLRGIRDHAVRSQRPGEVAERRIKGMKAAY